MSDKLVAIDQRLKRGVDVTKLVEYTKKISEIGSINNMMAPIYLKDFINAYDLANTMLSVAVRCDLEASSELKTAESIAYLDRAPDYLSQNDIKITDESKKRYVEVDEDVKKAREIKAKTTALVSFLKNKLQSFRMAHDDVKKMVYGDQYQTPNEGF